MTNKNTRVFGTYFAVTDLANAEKDIRAAILNALPIGASEFGTLLRKATPNNDDETLVMVRVLNRSAEPDGSHKTYFLRVPPHVTTARQAVAWTFGLGA